MKLLFRQLFTLLILFAVCSPSMVFSFDRTGITKKKSTPKSYLQIYGVDALHRSYSSHDFEPNTITERSLTGRSLISALEADTSEPVKPKRTRYGPILKPPVMTVNLGLGFYYIFAEGFDDLYASMLFIDFGAGVDLRFQSGLMFMANGLYLQKSSTVYNLSYGFVDLKWIEKIIDFQVGYYGLFNEKKQLYFYVGGGPAIFQVREQLKQQSTGIDLRADREATGLALTLGGARFLNEKVTYNVYLQYLHAKTTTDLGTKINVGGVTFLARLGYNFML